MAAILSRGEWLDRLPVIFNLVLFAGRGKATRKVAFYTLMQKDM